MKYLKINGTELFGSATQDGFVELAGLDSNNDHKITHQDTAWTELKVWQDSNQDGIAQSGELHTLDELNISELSQVNGTGFVQDNGVTQYYLDSSGYTDSAIYVGADKANIGQSLNDISQIKFGGSLAANDVRWEMGRRAL